ncbi:MAG: sulfotransferase [bacterium]
MPKPNFIFIGPSKTGSTWIFELLRSHPAIYIPVAKDIYFFDKYFDKGVKWYEKQFKGGANRQIAGELSHDYFSSKIAIDRIRMLYPSIKLICCLRNPFDRAVSSYKYFQRNGLALGDFAVEIRNHPEIFEEGLYYKHLSYILSNFDYKNVLVLYFDDLKSNSDEFARRIFNFIEVDGAFKSPVIGKQVNESGSARSLFVAKIIKKIAVLVRNCGYPCVVGYLKRNNIILRILYSKGGKKIVNNFSFPTYVVNAYNEEITQLEHLLNVKLSHWRMNVQGSVIGQQTSDNHNTKTETTLIV